MRAALAIAVLATACTKYTHTSTTNAPGNVVDLDKPLAHENGDPARFEQATDPGTQYLLGVIMPSMLFGSGRFDRAEGVSVEAGLAFRFELHDSTRKWTRPHLGVTAGMGFAQFEGSSAELGALYGEVNVRFPTVGHVVPLDIGLGPAVYAADFEAGGQLTLRFPLLAVRLRYMPRSGLEAWAGYEIPIPVIFGRSK